MPYTHRSAFGNKKLEAVDEDQAYLRAKNRKEDLDRQLKTTQIRDHVRHPGKAARKAEE